MMAPAVMAGGGSCSSSVSHDTHYHGDGVSGGEAYQDWHVNFNMNGNNKKYGCSSSSPDWIQIQDDDGNSVKENNPGNNYRVQTGDYNWLQGGDDVSVRFHDSARSGGATSSWVTKTMPRANRQPDDPRSPSPGDNSEADTGSPTLSVYVTDPDNQNMDVTFYRGNSPGSVQQVTRTRSWPGSNSFDTQSRDISRVERAHSVELTDPNNNAYGHHHGKSKKGSTNFYVEVYHPDQNSWNRIWSTSTGGSTNMYGISHNFNTPKDVSRVRIGCGGSHCYHNMGSLDFDFQAEGINGNEIGTENNVNSGSRAYETFNGASCGNSYNWYASADDGERLSVSSTFSFDISCNDPPSISGLSFGNQNGHQFTASASVSDPDNNIDRCEFDVSSSSGSQTYTDNSPGSSCTVNGINYQDVNANHLENVDVDVTVYDSFGETDSTSGSKSFPNNSPSAGSMQITDIIASHAFNVTVPVSDPDDGSSELDSCNWRFEAGSDTYTESTTPSSGECHFGNFSNAINGFDVGENIDIELEVTDIHGASSSSTGSASIQNREPVFSDPIPPNTSIVADEQVETSVLVNDVEDENLNVYFFNSENDELIGKDSARSGRRGMMEWENLQVGSVYDWYVKVSDGYTNVSNRAEDWNFTKTLSGDYRLRTDIQHRYSSVVTSTGSTSFLTFDMQNPVSANKTVDIRLQGVNAEFSDGSTEKQVEIGPYGNQKHQIQVTPSTNGSQQLEVITTESDTGIENRDTIEVLVKDLQTSTSRVEEVPGVQMIQLVVMAMMAGAVFLLSS